ncbi:MAG: ATP phosphoribosyltransferase [Gammaproteobacteria bacterium]|nr:ATP phosphoribosyltransferase [Gammaproteobacteria bacterium]
MTGEITIALSKGRILEQTLPLLAGIGIEPDPDDLSGRKLILGTNRAGVKLVVVRATDVPTYVSYGAADLGVAGKDVLMEHQGEPLYEPLDLNIARCKLMLAGYAHRPLPTRPRIATKYVNSARAYFAQRGSQVEIIKLYGSMELAPIVGLADAIVDLVDTGNTLRANGLVPLEEIAEISARLVVNRAAMKLKHDAVTALVDGFADLVELAR